MPHSTGSKMSTSLSIFDIYVVFAKGARPIAHHPKNTDRIESTGEDAGMLDESQIGFYQENGYLVVENLLGQKELDEIRGVIAKLRLQAAHLTGSDARFDVASGHSAATPKLRRVKDPVLQDPVFDRLMRSDKLLDIVAPLVGGSVRFDHSKLNFKPAGGKAGIEWHQDWAFYPHTNDDLLAVGVMIEDCVQENGPLQVIPGSHKGPLYDHHSAGVFAGGVQPEVLGSDLGRAVSLTAPAGSISIHHVRTLHASGENRSDRERPLLLFSYAAVDTFPVFDSYDLEEFDTRILRGERCLAPRMEAVPVRIPLPRAATSDSIYDNQMQMAAT